MARITNAKHKWVPLPNDSDEAKIRLVLLKPGQKRRLGLSGVDILGTAIDGDFENPEVSFKTDPQKKKVAWLVELFDKWENFYTKDGSLAPCDRPYKMAFLDELSIMVPDDEGGEKEIDFHEWVLLEYEIFEKASKAELEIATGN